jgi:hypothetical protein
MKYFVFRNVELFKNWQTTMFQLYYMNEALLWMSGPFLYTLHFKHPMCMFACVRAHVHVCKTKKWVGR